MKNFKVQNFIRIVSVPVLAIGVIITLNCGKKTAPVADELILAKIGDKTISVTEFYKRAEYTIRPPYCKLDNYVHKKVILNSLIAEKLFALEAEAANDSALMNNKSFMDFVQGRREQEMRKYLYKKEGLEKVNLDSSLIKQTYRFAGRTFKVAYFSVNSPLSAELVKKRLETNTSFENIYQEIVGSEKIPEREVTWDKEGNDMLQNALFMDQKQVGQVIGPLEAEDGMYTTIKILGWNDDVAIGETKINQRMADVREKLTRQAALNSYAAFASKVMKGKKVEFDENTFFKVTELVQPFYMPTQEQKEESFNRSFWNKNDDGDDSFKKFVADFSEIKDEPFLRIDGETWTVERLRKEIAIHPLVYRKQKFAKNQFPEQFKLAVVDLIRDKYLAEEAYKRGYDKAEPVQRTIEMWVDNARFLNHMQDYLTLVGSEYNYSKEYMSTIKKYLNPYVDSLQTKYSDKIEINTDIFERLKLTRIDMVAMEKNVPYPVTVPGFPVVTDDNRLNYGKKMEE
ncbi:MAG TPA: hypothetical protein PLP19_20855 [bacterium]|nr:hypothetical protein [bacterium]HPN45946.1 hypothetical protein [bacterium]